MKYKQNTIDEIVKSLIKGKIVCFPTDTVHALAVDSSNSMALSSLFNSKRRPLNKPLSIFIDDIKNYVHLMIITEKQLSFISQVQFLPLTFIVQRKNTLHNDKILRFLGKKMAFRLPNHPIAKGIIGKFNGAIASTSLNISGEKNIENIDDIPSELNIDTIIFDDNLKNNHHSTIVEFKNDDLILVRDGVYDFKQLKSLYDAI